MNYYLSSYKIGNEVEKLKALIPKGNRKFGYIHNALDFSQDLKRLARHIQDDLKSLQEVGIDPEVLDLKNYFWKKDNLQAKMFELGGVWISGGSVFVLRQAMRASGLDEILKGPALSRDFLYGGYSAAGCVLSPDLRAYQIVDDATLLPYEEVRSVIWEGLELVDYAFMPHFDSDHPESANIDKEIEYCKENNIPFKAVRDGEVVIFGSNT